MNGELPSGPGMGIQVKVISITDATGPDPMGGFTKGRNVTYQLSTGHTGTVFIPLNSFNADAVKAAIANDARTIAQVAGLQVTI